jgi:hypothetical protein
MQYFVKVREVHYIIIPVEASSEEEAKQLAGDKLHEAGDDLVYDYTMDPEEWDVWE